MRNRLSLGAALGTAVLALIALFVSAPFLTGAAQAAGSPYVALGDSYASGTGTRDYIDDGTACQRSTKAYPALVAAARGYTLDFRACSGARVGEVTANQLGSLSSATRYVTVSVGGNDAGFTDVLTECAQPGWMSDCHGAIDGAQAFIENTLPSRLSGLYAEIAGRAPNAKVVVVGYPRLFMGEDCNALTWFAPDEQTRLNQTADLLNSRMAAQASAHGFAFANPTDRFIGHAVCDDPEWLNGLSNPITESYHPNTAGHASGYAPLVSPVLTGARLTAREAAAARTAAAQTADELAAQQRKHADADRRVTPERVELPDLTSPEARAAARRAGVDLSDRASIDRADRISSQRQYAAWLAGR